jgi:hypothetical protein
MQDVGALAQQPRQPRTAARRVDVIMRDVEFACAFVLPLAPPAIRYLLLYDLLIFLDMEAISKHELFCAPRHRKEVAHLSLLPRPAELQSTQKLKRMVLQLKLKWDKATVVLKMR